MISNRSLFLTGSNGGIGRAIIRKYAEEKYNIYACLRNDCDEFQKFIQELENVYQISITRIIFDIKNSEQGFEKIKTLIQNQKIDVLINNAGVNDTSLYMMTKKNRFREVFEINFFFHIELTQIFLKSFLRNKSGHIINISSSAANDCPPGRSAYNSSKSALETWGKTLAKELGPTGIKVNNISPGFIDTKMSRQTDNKIVDDTIKQVALRRVGKPIEIANLCYFLTSEFADYINGQTIRIDGGM